MATYVIGDIHGALKALQQLIEKINPKEEDTLIFLGDCVDGWSESAGVIAWLMELQHRYHCVFIKGNHDAWCESWLNGVMPEPIWVRSGGAATISSYENLPDDVRALHREFINRMRLFFIDDQQRLFVHAGFTSLHGPEHERFEHMLYWDRSLWELALALDSRLSPESLFYPRRLKKFKEIYLGHTPTLNYGEEAPMRAANVYNLDTGAAFTGRISALNIDTKEVWQSDVVQWMYPGEKGRNG